MFFHVGFIQKISEWALLNSKSSYFHCILIHFLAGPWTVFAPTNTAFMNLPMKELEELITNPKKLSKLVLNHIINR